GDYGRILGPLQKLRSLLPPWAMIGAFLFPAVFEEFFFRGYLFSALLNRGGPRVALWTSALLFGLFHLVVTDVFELERLVPSTVLGLVLGWVCLRSGSVWPAVLLHACHDG